VPQRLDEKVPEVGGCSLAAQSIRRHDVGYDDLLIFGNWPYGHEGFAVAVLPADEAVGLGQVHGAELRTCSGSSAAA
jgi:hypothetical protein